MHSNARACSSGTQAASIHGHTGLGRPSPSVNPTPNNSTDVTIGHGGGGAINASREAEIRAQPPDVIVLAARAAAEKASNNPIRIIGGHWAGGAKPTGNFVYTISGEVSYSELLPYTKILRSPLGGIGELIPSTGWVWAQICNITVLDREGCIYSAEDLLRDIQYNPLFADTMITVNPHWQLSEARLQDCDSATVIFAYVDEDHSLTHKGEKVGLYMFGQRCRLVDSSDTATLSQCGRCHAMGHTSNAPTCPLPVTAVKCYKCGGNHHSDQHTKACPTQHLHTTAGHCLCKFKCVLCGRMGHHCWQQSCPKRGQFSLPPLVYPQPTPQASGSVNPPTAPARGKDKATGPRIPKEVPTQRELPDDPLQPPPCLSAAARKNAKRASMRATKGPVIPADPDPTTRLASFEEIEEPLNNGDTEAYQNPIIEEPDFPDEVGEFGESIAPAQPIGFTHPTMSPDFSLGGGIAIPIASLPSLAMIRLRLMRNLTTEQSGLFWAKIERDGQI